MKKRSTLLIVVMMMISRVTFAQFGEIKGKIIDKLTGTPLAGATVSWTVQGKLSGAITDTKGEYSIKPMSPGDYNLDASFVTYKKQHIEGVKVSAEKATYIDFALESDNALPPVIIRWTPPMIDKGYAGTIETYDAEEIENSIQRDVTGFVALTAGVTEKEEGGSINVRGSREANTLYVVDGIKMSGPFSIPKSAIAEISVLTGGIPAQFGDATGGVVIITTKSYKFK